MPALYTPPAHGDPVIRDIEEIITSAEAGPAAGLSPRDLYRLINLWAEATPAQRRAFIQILEIIMAIR